MCVTPTAAKAGSRSARSSSAISSTIASRSSPRSPTTSRMFQTDVLGGDNRGNWRLTDRPDRAGVTDELFRAGVSLHDRSRRRARASGCARSQWPSVRRIRPEIEAQWFHSDLDVLTQEASLKFPFANETPGLDTHRGPYRDRQQRRAAARHLHGKFGRSDFVRQEHGHYSRQLRVEIQVRQRRRGALQRGSRVFEGGPGRRRTPTTTCVTRSTACARRMAGRASSQMAPRRRTTSSPTTTATASCPRSPWRTITDLFTRPDNGFFKSHWVFGDTTEVENWSARGDIAWDPEFIESGGVTFTAGLRLARTQGRLRVRSLSWPTITASARWTARLRRRLDQLRLLPGWRDRPEGVRLAERRRRSTRNPRPAELPGGQPLRHAHLRSSRRIRPSPAPRAESEQINGFWDSGHRRRQQRAGRESIADGEWRRLDPVAVSAITRSPSSKIRCRASRWRRRRVRRT